jgi:serine phosphatase RsbU (regulator of sigma subunit)
MRTIKNPHFRQSDEKALQASLKACVDRGLIGGRMVEEFLEKREVSFKEEAEWLAGHEQRMLELRLESEKREAVFNSKMAALLQERERLLKL